MISSRRSARCVKQHVQIWVGQVGQVGHARKTRACPPLFRLVRLSHLFLTLVGQVGQTRMVLILSHLVPPWNWAGGTEITLEYHGCTTCPTLSHQKINVLLHARSPTMTTPKNGRQSRNTMPTCRAMKSSGWPGCCRPTMARLRPAPAAAGGCSGVRA